MSDPLPRRLRSTPFLVLGPGPSGMQLSQDERGHKCHTCGGDHQVRFFQAVAPDGRRGHARRDPRKVYLSICGRCIEALANLERIMQLDQRDFLEAITRPAGALKPEPVQPLPGNWREQPGGGF